MHLIATSRFSRLVLSSSPRWLLGLPYVFLWNLTRSQAVRKRLQGAFIGHLFDLLDGLSSAPRLSARFFGCEFDDCDARSLAISRASSISFLSLVLELAVVLCFLFDCFESLLFFLLELSISRILLFKFF